MNSSVEDTPATALPEQLHPGLAALLPELVGLTTPPAAEVGVGKARSRFAILCEAGLSDAPEVAVEELALGAGLTARCYRPDDARGATVVYFHGGGWVLGGVAEYDGLARRLAARLPAVVVSVEYRLAPEHPFPAAVADALLATRWALAEAERLGGDPAKVAVAGDSAGGNLAAVAAQQLRGAGLAAQLLLYPNTSRGADADSVRAFGDVPYLTLTDMAWYSRQYVPRGTSLADPRICPAEGDLTGLPPALVVTAGVDPLHDSGRDYAHALQAAGTPAEWLDLPDLPHGFAHLAALSRPADAGLVQVLERGAALLHGEN